MGKLELGQMLEVNQRVTILENTKVVKVLNAEDTGDSDVIILAEEE
jgi:hypothetical protein